MFRGVGTYFYQVLQRAYLVMPRREKDNLVMLRREKEQNKMKQNQVQHQVVRWNTLAKEVVKENFDASLKKNGAMGLGVIF